MKDRIRKVRKENNLTQKEFAERLGIKQNTVASYEMGRIGVSDSVIISICREFNVREEWLRNGNGKMPREIPNKLSFYFGQIEGGDDEFIKELIEVYMELDPDSKKALQLISERMAEKRKNRGQS